MPQPIVSRSEYLLNTSVAAGAQFETAVAALADGRVAATWQSDDGPDSDVRFSLRRANGDAVAASFDDENLAVSGTIQETQAAVAGLTDNRSAYVWKEQPTSGFSDVFMQVRNADGSILKDRFAVSAGGTAESDPSVIGLANGNIMVALLEANIEFTGIRVHRFDIAGNSLGFILINSAPPGGFVGNETEMTLLGSGSVAITWSNNASQQVFAIVNASGAILKAETDVNPEDAVGENPEGDVVALADGNFVAILDRDADANDIQGRLFNSAGNAIGGRFDISSGAGGKAAATALRDGRFMVVYEDDTGGIGGRVLNADGTPDGAEFAVTSAAGAQEDPEIATLADGRVAVSWGTSQAGAFDAFAEIYDPREVGLDAGATGFGDDWIGTGFADAVKMGEGNDRFDGMGGNDVVGGDGGLDTLVGGDGNDKLFGGAQGDVLNGGIGVDLLDGGLGADSLSGDAGDDLLQGGDGGDQLSGGTENDRLVGGKANDSLFCGAGGDKGEGGAGNDTIFGEADKDTLLGEAGNDTVQGGDGNDIMDGGSDNDRMDGGLGINILKGGLGLDVFVFADDDGGNDRVDDWVAADDQLEMDASNFGGGLSAGPLAANRLVVGAGPVANQAFGQFLFNTVNGQLSWDADGTGVGAAVAITKLFDGGVAVGTLAAADFAIVA